MKKQKLNIEALKVESFVTKVEQKQDETIQGGGWWATTICAPHLTIPITIATASLAFCKQIGEDLGTRYSANVCGDSMGVGCKIITV